MRTAFQILEQNRKNYNLIADDFNIKNQTGSPEFELLSPYIKEGMKILDIGCGNGRLYKYLNDTSGIKYWGVDNSDELIKIAKKNNPNGEFKAADVFDLPFNNGEFDVVAGIAFLHHIPSQELRTQVLKEIHRVLKPGGILFLTNWNLFRWEIISHNVKRNKMNPLHFFFPFGGMDVGDFWMTYRIKKEIVLRYYHHFRKCELKTLVEKAGFKIIFYKKERNITTVLKRK